MNEGFTTCGERVKRLIYSGEEMCDRGRRDGKPADLLLQTARQLMTSLSTVPIEAVNAPISTINYPLITARQ